MSVEVTRMVPASGRAPASSARDPEGGLFHHLHRRQQPAAARRDLVEAARGAVEDDHAGRLLEWPKRALSTVAWLTPRARAAPDSEPASATARITRTSSQSNLFIPAQVPRTFGEFFSVS
ncbi:MAG: hypothetical protein R3D59_17865 [Paracoccaceae bacterium]